MDFSKGVLFDPGYSQYTLPFSQNIDAAYNMLFSIKSPHERKFKFKILYPQLLKLLENTVDFYLGCLLWATFISRNFTQEPKNILGNNYIGCNINEDEALYEVNYALSYIEKIVKDCKYYMGKNCNIPDEWSKILIIYKEFLITNKFLTEANTTTDIKIPSSIKQTSNEDLSNILNTVENAIKNGDLRELFKVKHLIIN